MLDWKAIAKSTLSLLIASLIFLILLPEVIAPFLTNKLERLLNEKLKGFTIGFSQLELSIINNSISLNKIRFHTKSDDELNRGVGGEIGTIHFQGIHWMKVLFKKELVIRKIQISDPIIQSPFPGNTKKTLTPELAGISVQIGTLAIDGLHLKLVDTLLTNSLLVDEGQIKINNLAISAKDTLSFNLIKKFQFSTKLLQKTSRDSLYTFNMKGVNYSNVSRQLSIDTITLVPNYSEYAFANKHPLEVDRFHINSTNIHIYDVAFEEFILTNNLVCSYGELSKLDLKIFRDKRKPDSHGKKVLVQDLMHSYPGILRIDSLKVLDGTITYKEHAENAAEAGHISFNKLNTRIYQINNDTIHLDPDTKMELYFDALLMDKARLHLFLKIKLLDPAKTIFFGGHLSGFDLMALNPIFGRNAFTYVTSGKVESLQFKFQADKVRARGRMDFRYHDLRVAVKDPQKDDTIGIKSKLLTFLANKKILDANPLPDENPRVGVIYYERNPEKFLLNYCFKATFSGIKSTILKPANKKSKTRHKIFNKRKVI
ncbi:MAG: hypothetical protein ABI761_03635 [Saprospiraceae bacterium]